MRTAFFSDLDGTLIFSRRWLPASPPAIPVERDSDGMPRAWMSTVAAATIRELRREGMEFIPTTTRVSTQFRRVHVPGGPTRYAIVANGMRVLVDGVPDRAWSDQVTDSSCGCAPISAIESELARVADGAPWLRSVRSEDGIAILAAAHGARIPRAIVLDLRNVADQSGYRLWQHRRKTYLIPAHATKEAAAAEVASRLGAPVVAAAGDTAFDHGLLAWADHAMQPAHADPGSSARTTELAGIAAGEEITSWALALATRRPSAVSAAEGTAAPQGW